MNSIQRVAGAPSVPTASEPIVIELTHDEAWALVSAVRPMCITGKQCVDVSWVQQRVFAELQARMSRTGLEN